MGRFRIEILPAGDMYLAKAFWGDGDQPFVISDPIYPSRDAAEHAIKRILTQAWPDTAPDAVDPTIGV